MDGCARGQLFSVSSVQGQKVLFDDVDNDVSDIIVIAGYGADNGMIFPTEPNIQYFKMQLQNSVMVQIFGGYIKRQILPVFRE